jgi:hypothetical protein
VPLENGTDGLARADCVAVSPDGNVYVAGHKEFRAMLWENGKLQRLSDPNSSASDAYCIAVDGKDVYVGGKEARNGALWKNGVKRQIALGDEGGRNANVMAICVSGGCVYAAVRDVIDDDNAAGGLRFRPLLWKDGVFTKLPNDGVSGATTTGIFVTPNADVYVIGNEYDQKLDPTPVLWKNGVLQQRLPYDGFYAWSSALSVSGENTYIGGYQVQDSDAGVVSVPTLWINDKVIDLRPSGMTDSVFGVFVVPKGEQGQGAAKGRPAR